MNTLNNNSDVLGDDLATYDLAQEFDGIKDYERPYVMAAKESLKSAIWAKDRMRIRRILEHLHGRTNISFSDLMNSRVDESAEFTWPMFAARFGNESMCLEVDAYGGDFEASTSDGWTPLRTAVCYDNLEAFNFIIGNTGWRPNPSVDVNIRFIDGHTPLTYIAENRPSHQIEMVHALVKQGADVSLKTAEGKTAEMIAAETGNLEVAQLLAEIASKVELEKNIANVSRQKTEEVWNSLA